MVPSQPPRVSASPDNVRPLAETDLDRLVAIDREATGRSRRGFYDKRLAAMRRTPAAFVGLGHDAGGGLDGFVLAQLLDGEFGGHHPVAVLDALGVPPAARHHGIGHVLFAALETALRRRGARELRTQAAWQDRDLLRLFDAVGFVLAPRLVLERPADGTAF
jgi:GNAT superfamily N-acetyltransferase